MATFPGGRLIEAEWQTTDNLPRLVWRFRSRPWRRRCLFICAGWGTARASLTGELSRTALAFLESVAEGHPPYDHFDAVANEVYQIGTAEAAVLWDGPVTPASCRFQAATLATRAIDDYEEGESEEEWGRLSERAADLGPGAAQVWQEAAGQLCDLARCIFGNPHRPVTADPAWLTPTAVALAEHIYAERAFDSLPILADALEDAGCDRADLLAHMRGPGPHVRGCWALDLVLEKK